MKKKLLLAIICVVMVSMILVVFTGCTNGTYIYDGVLGEGSIKLGSFNKITMATDIVDLKINNTGKYKLLKKKDDGSRDIVITIVVEDEEKTINGIIDKDGNLIIANIYRFVK